MNRGYWTGDEWRWNVDKQPLPHIESIQVIEPAEERKSKGPKVPFGFAPRDEVAEPAPDASIDWLDVVEWAEGA